MSFLTHVQWTMFRNVGEEATPPFSAMTITGGDVTRDGKPYLKCEKPDSYGAQFRTVINGPLTVQPDAYGSCTDSPKAFVTFDDADGDPEPGDCYGPIADSWLLRKYVGGFLVISKPQLEGSARGVWVRHEPLLHLDGVAAEDIFEDESGTVNVKPMVNGVMTDRGDTINAREYVGGSGDIEINSLVICQFDPNLIGETCKGWKIIGRRCD